MKNKIAQFNKFVNVMNGDFNPSPLLQNSLDRGFCVFCEDNLDLIEGNISLLLAFAKALNHIPAGRTVEINHTIEYDKTTRIRKDTDGFKIVQSN